MLLNASIPDIPDQDNPDCSPQEELACAALEVRGCVRRMYLPDDVEALVITPRGRLALVCDAAFRMRLP